MFFAPPLKLFGGEFRADVVSDNIRLTSPSDNALQGLNNAFMDRDVSISMAKASRVQSSMTLKVRNLRSPIMLSLIKSMFQL
jgi:hypothetical protein